MNEALLLSLTDAGEELGLSRQAVGEVARKLGITPKPMTHGRAKGLDAADIRKIRKALNIPRAKAAAATAV